MPATVTISPEHAEALDRVEEITQMRRWRLVAWLLDKALADGGAEALAARITEDGKGWGPIAAALADAPALKVGAAAIFGARESEVIG